MSSLEPKNTGDIAGGKVRPCLVQVYFPGREMTLVYFNDRFELKPGDWVFTDGKLEGLPGQVKELHYSFKIRLSDYRRIIAVADTRVSGEFFKAGGYLLTFEPQALPREKLVTWFKAPGEEEIVSSAEDSGFPLDSIPGPHFSPAIVQRGLEYHLQHRVQYLSLDNGHGWALVSGSRPYEVEFDYDGGEVSGLVCECYCACHCKHEFAVLVLLQELLVWLEKEHGDRLREGGYFAAVDQETFARYVLDGRGGHFIFGNDN